ncbi:hypothetical protein M885DRAFT_527175 [Pelagophyceae sp. CCMP2097]|nr:hypothetical protein M885DRAFT_527175 [Pelagophyceae sp. CCMP2097]
MDESYDTAPSEVAPLRLARYYSAPAYCVASRTTHMDIMCLMSTPEKFVAPSPLKRRQSKVGQGRVVACRLPYAESNGDRPRPDKLTISEQLFSDLSRKRVSNQMRLERDRFMAKLNDERKARVHAEQSGATLFQAVYRGFAAQPAHLRQVRLRLYKEMRKPRLPLELESQLPPELLGLAKVSGLSALRGLTLAPAETKSKKQLQRDRSYARRCAQAATVLQAASRRRLNRFGVEQRRLDVADAGLGSNVAVLQSSWRGHSVRGKASTLKTRAAAAAIQSQFRALKASQKVQKQKWEMFHDQRRAEAAVKIESKIRARFALRLRQVRQRSDAPAIAPDGATDVAPASQTLNA